MQRCHLQSDPHLGSWNGLLRHVADGPPDLGTGGSHPAAYYTQLLRHIHRCGWTAFACRGSDPCASQHPCGVPAHLHCKGRSFDRQSSIPHRAGCSCLRASLLCKRRLLASPPVCSCQSLRTPAVLETWPGFEAYMLRSP
ncbi:unnamed protein product [Symbiodinium microadriaticum]|nr:unnamed protein product [Symbiodinium microadriaticum]